MGKTESEQLLKSDLHSFQEIRFFIFTLGSILLVALIFSSCANRGIITGGEEDTIPPEMLSSVPFNQSLNFRGTEILMTFSERVQAPQLKRKLLITPFTDTPYKLKVNRYVVQLTFDEPFTDSTTYTLNFADAITDVTESNPVQNAIIAFSTWDVIDSLTLTGKIVDHLSKEPIPGAAVSVYQAMDTLDIFTGKPYYFAFTDENGDFLIRNMKAGNYRVYAFQDDNGNYTNESSTEAHGFLRDTLLISETASDSLTIGLILQDVQDLKFVNSRPLGNRFDVRYNKYVQTYTIDPIDSLNEILPSNITSENLVIRFYNEAVSLNDSIGYYLTASDSVGNSRTDTVYVKFSERENRADEFAAMIAPKENAKVERNARITFRFPEPVKSINPDSLLVQYDSLRSDRIDTLTELSWNFNRTELNMELTFDQDFLPRALEEIRQRRDSLITLDTLGGMPLDSARALRQMKRRINPLAVYIYSGRGAFLSVENDSSSTKRIAYQLKQSERYGKISGKIDIDSTYFVVQLVNSEFKTIQQIENKKNYLFNFIPPGSYNIRVLVDKDGDGKWSFGNIRLGLEPEPVFFHSTFIDLRENWEINNINVTIPNVNKL